MISRLHGVLEYVDETGAVVNVNGVGFHVFLPSSALSSLGAIGGKVHLHTHLVVKEDSLTLYGFTSAEEIRLFQMLLSVSGIGPKLALGLLSGMSVERISLAIASGSADELRGIPGIGKKTAERLVLELRDKVGAGMLAGAGASLAGGNADLIAALTSLGYSVAEAGQTVSALPASAAKLNIEEKVRLALQYLGKK